MKLPTLVALSLATLFASRAFADNPLITDQFTADPTARLFEGQIYVYPSHDMPAAKTARGGSGWFAMEDYHTFSSENLLDWTDHGVIVSQTTVPWVNPSNAMWAPECVFKNGKYYFFFPAPGRAAPRAGAPGAPAGAPGAPGGPGAFAGGPGAPGAPAGAPPAGPFAAGGPPATGPAGGPPTTGPGLARGGRGGARRGGGGGGGGGGQRIGVAIADHPGGPFKPEATPITGIGGIDPCVLIDPKDGQAYIYTANNSTITVAKLKDNMTELDGPTQNLPKLVQDSGLVEGPFIFERKGIYYLTFPHNVKPKDKEGEELEYAMGPSPLGPFKWTGVIMDQTPNGAWTNHHSLVEYKGQWILFYHDKLLSPDFDKDRSIQADYVTFNDDGTINKVVPTLRGVGIADAKRKIQIDRFSAISKDGAAVDYINKDKTFDGWKTTFTDKGAWVQYNRVDFGAGLKSINVRAMSSTGGTLEIHLDKADSPVLAKIEVPKGSDWANVTAKLSSAPTGQHDLIVTQPDKNEVAVDWVSFE